MLEMANFRKMYAVLCFAVDHAIDALERIPAANDTTKKLHAALLEAEELYIDSCDENHEDVCEE